MYIMASLLILTRPYNYYSRPVRLNQTTIRMRKVKNNDREDLVRLYKTPSPTNFAQLRSPRVGKNTNRVPEANFKSERERGEQFDVFKAYLMQTKDKESNASSENEDIRLKKGAKAQKNESKPSEDPYNTYFIPEHSSTIQQKKQKGNTSRSISRKTSMSKESESQSGKNCYQQTIRKLANENIRLKHECKVMHEKYEKVSQDKRNIINQINGIKEEYESVRGRNQQMAKKEGLLNEEIKGLKKMLSLNSEELSVSNYEIYKMKQEIFELKLCIEKAETKKKERSGDSQGKAGQFISQKKLPPPSTDDQASCKKCKQKNMTIGDLVTQCENIRFQLGEKTSIINSLCTEIQRLEGELKLLQKPRQMVKKYNAIISQINEEIISEKAKQLSFKYVKLTK